MFNPMICRLSSLLLVETFSDQPPPTEIPPKGHQDWSGDFGGKSGKSGYSQMDNVVNIWLIYGENMVNLWLIYG